MKISDLSSLVVVDTETTGDNPFIHEILSAAFVPLIGDNFLDLHIQVRENASWSKYGQSVFQNFEQQWESRAIQAREAVRRIEGFVEESFDGREVNLIGHNVAFDRFFLAKLASRAGVRSIRGISHRTIDTYSVLSILHLLGRIPKEATSSSGAFSYFGVDIPESARHTALGDAIATRKLFLKLLEEFKHL